MVKDLHVTLILTHVVLVTTVASDFELRRNSVSYLQPSTLSFRYKKLLGGSHLPFIDK